LKKLNIAIVGAGRMGRIRAQSAGRHPDCRVAAIVDTDLGLAEKLAAEFGCAVRANWSDLLDRAGHPGEKIDAVVVATPHRFLAPISASFIESGIHVLCEKPGARTSAEAETVLRALYGAWPQTSSTDLPARRAQGVAQLVMGFTLRHHPAVQQARKMVAAGEIGRPMYVLGRYGHGGRPGYEREWRGIREQSGGGELLDQGVHLIDLSRCFLGEFQEISGFVDAYYWRAKDAAGNDPVEDNAFVLMRSAGGRVASLHASWTQWKNLFAFDVFGETGSIQVHGLGGSYGPEKIVVAHRRTDAAENGGAPTIAEIDFSAQQATGASTDAWANEWEAFVSAVLHPDSRDPQTSSAIQPASAIDAWQTLRIVEAAYQASEAGATIRLEGGANTPPGHECRTAHAV